MNNHPNCSSSVDSLLSRLERVRERGPGSWIARCPAHEDKNPSLSVRETSDGVTLVHCFAGCPATDVVAAVGLELSDLFPPQPDDHRGKPRSKPPVPWLDVVRLLHHNIQVIAMAAADLAEGRALSAGDTAAVLAAAEFSKRILEEAGS